MLENTVTESCTTVLRLSIVTGEWESRPVAPARATARGVFDRMTIATHSFAPPRIETGADVDTDAYVVSLLDELSGLEPEDTPGRRRVREEIIRASLPLAHRAARRFRGRGEPVEDLNQVATVGLIKAVDRFDADRGTPFTGFAMPTILGELKRYFRDRTWSVRVTRAQQELYLEVRKLVPEMAQRLGRSPSVADLAGHLGREVDEVRAAIDCGQAYVAMPLSTPVHDHDGATLADVLGAPDPAIERIADRQALREAITVLGERDREILRLRFVENRTQIDIAEKVGLSQMHVSRLIAAALRTLRNRMLDGEP